MYKLNQIKLRPRLGAFYAVQPGNKSGLSTSQEPFSENFSDKCSTIWWHFLIYAKNTEICIKSNSDTIGHQCTPVDNRRGKNTLLYHQCVMTNPQQAAVWTHAELVRYGDLVRPGLACTGQNQLGKIR